MVTVVIVDVTWPQSRLWNKLPVEIRRSQNVHTFKTRLKTYSFVNYYKPH